MKPARVAVVLKGYPRLSETFIAQELLALERRGLPLEIWSLRRPTDRARHPMHTQIQAPVAYLPEYLRDAPLRVLAGLVAALRRPRFPALLTLFARDFRRDPTASRIRRLGQALVLARELPADVAHLHVHFLHTPASVARYAALLTGRGWSFSAHAKDIWTTPDWDLREKLTDAVWGVTCTRDGLARLDHLAPGRTLLAYHGLDLSRFPAPPATRAPRDGSDPAAPLRLLCVGRLVAKKGHDDLIDAVAALPASLHWRLDLIGNGETRRALEAQVEARGLSARVSFRGSLAQPDVIAAMREADLFVLPTKPAPGGDRDGLPNVLMEAASQALPILATGFAGTPEFLTDGVHGVLVPPGEPAALAAALERLAGEPALRRRFGEAARARLVQDFSEEAAIDLIAGRLRASAGLGAAASASEQELSACAS
ncbi:D-inositol-3-phosphate glycosyltransferase [Methylobacterium tardum]|uniref:Colanic acid biosynthesis glycosyltransferase WcaL n=1 Tax=Methylobacterium tardum TaxID=374432 RepID=A0AA37WU00_9HYPH|nr:glycosyltransferase family 4 protein [Methylobacterium tardum]URD34282.1 glycosyltransferase family 4 protein [Methylobacterium tardum]GJE48439.1 D-inositol-3-phosphate glycosyltransferase [Methylobacterium tardum]GLS72669.1 colanic acid biosynthesis glycosyltransferase WcaL [Methylobacterium tardum]